MEKKIIIDFLHEHWDELITLLLEQKAGSRGCLTCFPDDMYEFIEAISHFTSRCSKQVPDAPPVQEPKVLSSYCRKAGESRENSKGCSSGVPKKTVKGLLQKAQRIRERACGCSMQETALQGTSIIVKNGLFVVHPQQSGEELNSSFKKLVDSVL